MEPAWKSFVQALPGDSGCEHWVGPYRRLSKKEILRRQAARAKRVLSPVAPPLAHHWGTPVWSAGQRMFLNVRDLVARSHGLISDGGASDLTWRITMTCQNAQCVAVAHMHVNSFRQKLQKQQQPTSLKRARPCDAPSISSSSATSLASCDECDEEEEDEQTSDASSDGSLWPAAKRARVEDTMAGVHSLSTAAPCTLPVEKMGHQ